MAAEGELGTGSGGARSFGLRPQWIVTTVVLSLLVAGALRLGIQNRHFVASHPMNLVWALGAIAVGFAVARLNGARVGFGRVTPWLGYGVLAAYLGFAIQGTVDGSLLRLFGGRPGLAGYFLLGAAAAAGQTFAKWIVLRFLGRLGGLETPARTLAIGLSVGLGFGIAEIVIVGENQIVRHVGITGFPWLGLWERASAVGLHVFSAAAIAIGLHRRQAGAILVVLALHSLDDWVGGSIPGGGVRMPPMAAQVFLTAVTVAMWAYYRVCRDAILREKPA